MRSDSTVNTLIRSGCRRAGDARRNTLLIVVTKTTDLRFKFTRRALDQTFRRNPAHLRRRGEQLRRRHILLTVSATDVRSESKKSAHVECHRRARVTCRFGTATGQAGTPDLRSECSSGFPKIDTCLSCLRRWNHMKRIEPQTMSCVLDIRSTIAGWSGLVAAYLDRRSTNVQAVSCLPAPAFVVALAEVRLWPIDAVRTWAHFGHIWAET
jgi:hypothetical protein